MFNRCCLVHYHEIGLKKNNRLYFERELIKSIKIALEHDNINATVERISGHILVSPRIQEQSGDAPDASCILDQTFGRLLGIPGIARVSKAFRCSRTSEEYTHAAKLALEECAQALRGFETFKVASRRSNTDFERSSMELNQEVGAHLCALYPEKAVRMHKPDITVHVHIVQGSAFVYALSEPGVGGLPVGTGGKIVSLLSSGIDSPVATWRLMRRGALVIPVHFSGRPQTNDSSEYLVNDICALLDQKAGLGRAYIVPFGDAQKKIAATVPAHLRVIIYRRLMLVVAERIAEIERAKAIVTGESLGQVASQTLENIVATNEVAHLPLFRPLIGSDKREIIADAQAIGTYEISIEDASDCCTLFMPRKPETHAKLDEVHAAWALLDIDELIERVMQGIEYIEPKNPRYRPPKNPPYNFAIWQG